MGAALTRRELRAVASRFRVLAVPARLQVLQALRGGPCHVSALIDATGLRQANLSKHLAVLRAHGLVAPVRRGRFIEYGIADPGVLALCDAVCGQVTRAARRPATSTGPRQARRPGAAAVRRRATASTAVTAK
ncbi:MAG: metalloregulator ArsR/SmtB family transcription factor [Vicinamibacterales bacterium]